MPVTYYRQACSGQQPLLQQTLLGLLPSKLDTTKAIVVQTGAVVDLTNVASTTIDANLNSGTWVYYETLRPRQILLTNPNWTVLSFDPQRKEACVQIRSPSGVRTLNFAFATPIF